MIKTQREGVFFALLGAACFSLMPIMTKNILAEGMQPVDIAIWRYIFAVPAIWLLIIVCRIPLPAAPLPRLQLMAVGTFLVAAALIAIFGLSQVPAGTFVVLFYTYPAIVALLSMLLGERLPVQGWLALGLTLVGIVLATPDFSEGLQGENFLGVMLALLNAGVVAGYFMTNSRVIRGQTAVARASAWALSGALMILLGIAAIRGLAMPPNTTAWLNLVGLALVSTVAATFAVTMGIQKLGPARAAITGTVEPFLTIFWATLLLGERMQPVQLVGGALILSSVVLLQLRRSSAPAAFPAKSAAAGD